jgi:phosphatidylserine/phosphatidylglycerophosphate/cardiolipin synthase-like enzyme
VPGEFATADAVENYFPNSIFPNTVEVRRFATNYTTPMHGKLITIDSQEAHILGSPIDQKYFDTTDHMISEPRRGAATGSGITTGVHDCSIKIVGPVVEHLRQTFFLQWNNVKGKTPVNPIPQMPTPPPSGDNVSVQIARTMPGDSRYNEVPKGETGMLEAYLRAFALATDYVYMESQYFQAQDLIAGIRLALQQNKNLQFIILINHEPDLIFYKRTQNLRIRQLIDGTTKDNTRNRLGLFTLWKHEAATPLNKIISIYIHAKLAVIDDKWAAVGTSNLDGTSLNITDWYSTLDVPLIPTEIVRESDEHRRSVEVNAVIFDGTGTNQPPNGMAEQLRRQLWAEHLGLDSSSSVLDPANRPAKGWLDLWNTKADAFKAALNANPPDATEKARILAWNAETDKNVKYLETAGVTQPGTRLKVLSRFPSFNFKTGKLM